MDSSDVLISIKQRYLDSIIAGEKTIELRRRAPRILAGSRVWIYCKSPNASISAVCRLSSVEVLPKEELWEKYSSHLAISRTEFNEYLKGSPKAAAIALQSVIVLENPLKLCTARSLKKNFHPPQFYMRLREGCALTQHLALELA